MAQVRYGSIISGTTHKQVGTRWEIEENGVSRLFEKFVCNAAEIFQRMPQRGSVHPVYPSLIVKRLSPVTLPAGLLEYTVEYSGVGGTDPEQESQELPQPVYRLQRSQRSDPITTHPNWSAIVAAAGSANVIYDDNGLFLGIGKDAADDSLVGVSDYLNFGAVFSKSFVSYSKPSLVGVGRISTPPGEAPAVASGFNWLKVAADYEQEGFVYAVYEAWMLSGRGGWNPTIYGS